MFRALDPSQPTSLDLDSKLLNFTEGYLSLDPL